MDLRLSAWMPPALSRRLSGSSMAALGRKVPLALGMRLAVKGLKISSSKAKSSAAPPKAIE